MDHSYRIERVLRLEPGKDNPRNSEGAIIELKDSKLLLAFTHFYGGIEDNAAAYIAGRYSANRGETWDEKDVLILENEGKENIMSVSLLRLSTGELAIFYMIKNGWNDCKLYMRRSHNDGMSWEERVQCITDEGYFVVNNDRVIQVSNDRIIVPTAYHSCIDGTYKTWNHRGVAMCFFSEDNGKSWRKCKTELEAPPHSKAGLQEPGVVELKDGSLMMWMRTDMGSQYISYSYDRGDTWSEVRPSQLISPLSPASIKRIPSTGDLLCIYNDHSGKFPYEIGKRTPLVSAISRDEGKTWENHKIIESDPDGWYCYTSIAFIDDNVILGYCAGNRSINGLSVLQITCINLEWFYS